MRAIVLVGGEGTRMRPLTWRTAKALVPVLGRPLLDHLVLHLKQHGFDHVTLAMTQRNPAIRDVLGNGDALGVHIEYAYEDTPLGSGGAIASIAAAWLHEGWRDTFAVVNGDVITDLNVSAMLDNHRATDAVLSLSLHEVEDPSPFGVVDIAENGRISRFVEKPTAEEAPSRLINAGTWLFEPELVERMDGSTFNRVEDNLFPQLCEAGEAVFGFHERAYWADVGTPRALLRVNLDMARGDVRSQAVSAPPGGVHQGRAASIEAGARIEAPAVVGAGSRIEAGARVRGSLLWDGVVLEEGATVEDSILASGVRIGAGATVRGSVIAHEVVVAAGEHLEGAVLEPAGHTANPAAAPGS